MDKQKINYRNLIICFISTIIFSIILVIAFKKFSLYLQPIEIISGIIGTGFLAEIGVITLFPVFEKEKKTKKKKKKKQSAFDRAIKNKMR